MTIEVQPARIVGAEIDDRVSWTTPVDAPATTWYGTIVGLSAENPGKVVVKIEDSKGGSSHHRARAPDPGAEALRGRRQGQHRG